MFKEIGDLLPRAVKKVGIHQQLKSEQIEKLFYEELERLLTQNIMERLKILYFKDGVITIACLEESIILRLKLYEEEIIYKINNTLCNNSLKEVRYLS